MGRRGKLSEQGRVEQSIGGLRCFNDLFSYVLQIQKPSKVFGNYLGDFDGFIVC